MQRQGDGGLSDSQDPGGGWGRPWQPPKPWEGADVPRTPTPDAAVRVWWRGTLASAPPAGAASAHALPPPQASVSASVDSVGSDCSPRPAPTPPSPKWKQMCLFTHTETHTQAAFTSKSPFLGRKIQVTISIKRRKNFHFKQAKAVCTPVSPGGSKQLAGETTQRQLPSEPPRGLVLAGARVWPGGWSGAVSCSVWASL